MFVNLIIVYYNNHQNNVVISMNTYEVHANQLQGLNHFDGLQFRSLCLDLFETLTGIA